MCVLPSASCGVALTQQCRSVQELQNKTHAPLALSLLQEREGCCGQEEEEEESSSSSSRRRVVGGGVVLMLQPTPRRASLCSEAQLLSLPTNIQRFCALCWIMGVQSYGSQSTSQGRPQLLGADRATAADFQKNHNVTLRKKQKQEKMNCVMFVIIKVHNVHNVHNYQSYEPSRDHHSSDLNQHL